MTVAESSSSRTTSTAAMEVTEAIKASLPQVYKAEMFPLDFTVGIKEGSPVSFHEAALDHSKEKGSVAFIVRRPG